MIPSLKTSVSRTQVWVKVFQFHAAISIWVYLRLPEKWSIIFQDRINRVNIVRLTNLVPKSTVDSTLRELWVKQRNFVFLIFFQSTDVSKGRSHSCRTSIARNKPYLQFYFLICSDITSPFLDFSWTLSGSATKFRLWYRRFYALTHWAWSFLVLYWLRNSSCFLTLSCTGFRTYLCIVLIIST